MTAPAPSRFPERALPAGGTAESAEDAEGGTGHCSGSASVTPDLVFCASGGQAIFASGPRIVHDEVMNKPGYAPSVMGPFVSPWMNWRTTGLAVLRISSTVPTCSIFPS